ncbi:MFS transporter [Kitasatospora purpeofusca]|uniref:MFS transporter n=1 Tax=Kitasatospora purpeofusca TaxID=67352 RepID=UPI0036D24781
MTTQAPPSLQPSRSCWLALGVLCTGNLMIILDGSIVTVALPTIQTDLGFTQSGLAWVVNAYVIAFAGLLLLSGRLGGLLGGSLVLLAGFVVRQAYAAKPLLPLHIFRSRAVSGANGIMVLMVAGLFGYQFCTALYFQNVLGYDALKTGLAFLPAPVTIAIVSLGLAVKLNQKFGPRRVLVAGLLLVAAALALLARVPSDGSFLADIVPPFVLLGLGFGAAMPALIGQAMAVTSPNDAGIASGLVNTSQQVGASIGTAVLATVAASRTATLLGEGHGRAEALTGGFHLAYGLSAVFVVVGVLLAAFVLRSPAVAAESAPGADLKSADSPVPHM